ncbi:alpha/beta hydrolase [Amycolatopsis antarctica]|uniref:Alpha/beta hydrolase n=1 Tax=Amycolatopsis antarctica TaxID=1854586 RepID=A0A263CZ26_9PSEU|nr:alpha/beta hydrolase [Amycolatopsis antarctica]OZM71219.1 alpha/beta hydrolase [Amycolatopsis antarctica]
MTRGDVAATVTALTLRPLTSVIPLNRPGIRLSRWIVASALATFGPPMPGSRFGPAESGPRGEWVLARGVVREDAAVLYVHGSGYVLCSARTHRGLTSRVSAGTGLPVFACDYRLAPRHRFPSAADDVRAAYDWLAAEVGDPGRIVLAGDSAGGHLAVDLTLQLLREGRKPPAALALFSPLFDPTFALAAEQERLRRDPLISAARAARLIDLYARDADPHSPRLRLSGDDVTGFPPALIQAGGREMLAADAVELARVLRRAGSDCELDLVPGQMHVFQALPRLIPEGRAALERACGFLAGHLPAASGPLREAS